MLTLKTDLPDSKFRREVLQLTIEIPGAGQALKGMIGEEHLNGELPCLSYFFRICVHDESLGGSEYTSCLEGAVPFNFNKTDPACSNGLYFRQIAECRYMHL